MPVMNSVCTAADDGGLPKRTGRAASGDALKIPPRLVAVLNAWSDLPPHIQETISLLAALESQQQNTYVGSGAPIGQRSSIGQQLQNARREMLRVLRHAPEQFGWRMDSEGWVSVEEVLTLVNRYITNARDIGIANLIAPLGDRVKVFEDRLRATYGHSAQSFCPATSSIPDVPLFHGTRSGNWSLIELFGLRTMSRRFVQLTSDFEYAYEVASSNGYEPLVLEVGIKAASEQGVRFFASGTHVWHATHVPAACLHIWTESKAADVRGIFEGESSDE